MTLRPPLSPVLALALAALFAAGSSCRARPPARAPVDPADALAARVVQASGGDAWHRIQRLKFTFVVEENGKTVVSAKHDWDLAAGTDTVSTADRVTVVSITRPLDDPEAKAAFQRWTNDSYWLLAPLKLMDPGVRRTHLGRETIDEKELEVLGLAFGQVGLTPGDQYRLYIDPKMAVVRAWDYIPAGGEAKRFTWEEYDYFGPLLLATLHRGPGGRTIRFTGISVQTH